MGRSVASIRRRFSGRAYASSPLPIAFPLLAFVSHLYHLFVLHDRPTRERRPTGAERVDEPLRRMLDSLTDAQTVWRSKAPLTRRAS